MTPGRTPRELINAESLGLKLYKGTSEEDVALAYWYEHLFKTGDLDLITTRTSRTLHGFLSMFQPDCFLTYSLFEDAEHATSPVEFAGWFSPERLTERVFYYSNWTHQDIRGKRRQIMLGAAVYEAAFTFADVLIGITKQKDLIKIHQKVGYTYGCAIPKLFDGHDGYILYLTKRGYESGRLKKAAHYKER